MKTVRISDAAHRALTARAEAEKRTLSAVLEMWLLPEDSTFDAAARAGTAHEQVLGRQGPLSVPLTYEATEAAGGLGPKREGGASESGALASTKASVRIGQAASTQPDVMSTLKRGSDLLRKNTADEMAAAPRASRPLSGSMAGHPSKPSVASSAEPSRCARSGCHHLEGVHNGGTHQRCMAAQCTCHAFLAEDPA